jgi:hypothetical protein
MLSFVGIIAGIALILAVLVSSLLIGTCLLIAWVTDTVGRPSGPGQRGGGRRTGRDAPAAGNGRRHDSGNGRRHDSGVPADSRRGYR